MKRRLLGLAVLVLLTAGLLVVLQTRVAGLPPMGTLLDPADGLYRTARQARHPASEELTLAALDAPVTVVRDDRGVPHIFAASDEDAITALGYVVAQDRLFQLDFLSRVASGRLAAALGPEAVSTDRFLRRTGMEGGARRNLRRIQKENGLEKRIITAYAAGVRAYQDQLAAADLPLEFRLLGYEPAPYSPLDVTRLLTYMTFNLTYGTDEPGYAALQQALSSTQYETLYPRFSQLFVPIVPGGASTEASDQRGPLSGARGAAVPQQHETARRRLRGTAAEGYRPGKGSNNWAVRDARSATGAPILAGDMHLDLTLPAIWYEVHLVTPGLNTYGVTIPGAPLPIEAFNNHVGWTFTNTGADQIDHYALALNDAGTRYRYEGGWRNLRRVPDTIRVNGAAPVIDTLRYAHWGPVVQRGDSAMAVQWVGHKPSRTLRALWGMNRATSAAAFREALRFWDTPMQNVLYASTGDTIAIRSAGFLPIRKAGHGAGLLDGTTDAFSWTGRVPFEELPHALNPERGYLFSANQQPTDSTYGYYLNHNWRDAFRALRIDTLLSAKPQHSVADLKRYQADVHAVQHDLFAPLLDTLTGLAARPDTLRQMLIGWNGTTATDRPEPLVLDVFLNSLKALTWDEAVFAGRIKPGTTQLYQLLRQESDPRWLDVQATPEREQAAELLRRALTVTADSLSARYGWGTDHWRWGNHHQIVFRHLTRSEALRPLWRGPVEYPGFRATLSPAQSRMTTHSASWRMVVDFSQQLPKGWGVYPGGQSGRPFSPFYDLHLPTYRAFKYYDLRTPGTPDALDTAHVSSRLRLAPGV